MGLSGMVRCLSVRIVTVVEVCDCAGIGQTSVYLSSLAGMHTVVAK